MEVSYPTTYTRLHSLTLAYTRVEVGGVTTSKINPESL